MKDRGIAGIALSALAGGIISLSLVHLHGAARLLGSVAALQSGPQTLLLEELDGRRDPELEARMTAILAELSERGGAPLAGREFREELSLLRVDWGRFQAALGAGETDALSALSDHCNAHTERLAGYASAHYASYTWGLTGFTAAAGLLGAAGLLFARGKRRREYERVVYTDNLTGIGNKDAFCRRAETLLRRNPRQEYTLIHFDLDNFKYVNKVYGYLTGDELLRLVAQAVAGRYREGEACARLYADHFAVLARRSEGLVDRLRELVLKAAGELLEGDCALACFFGVYDLNDYGEDVNVMLDKAEFSLREAKARKSCPVVRYDESVNKQLQRESYLAGRMQYALEHGEFKVYLQPKFQVSSQKVVGAEALVRWDSPELGLVPPNDFIPLFERNGFITRLDLYVLEMVCKRLRRQIDASCTDISPMAVNFSRVSVYRSGFVEDFLAVVERYGIPPSCIEVEITETVFGINSGEMLTIMQKLQEKGFKIAMDDFGSGYSSLNFLRRLPVDVLKLDKDFLEAGGGGSRTMDVIRCVVELGKSLRAQIVCEGVETEEQLQFLRELGCDTVQGFYFERPLPLNRYEEKYAGC